MEGRAEKYRNSHVTHFLYSQTRGYFILIYGKQYNIPKQRSILLIIFIYFFLVVLGKAQKEGTHKRHIKARWG